MQTFDPQPAHTPPNVSLQPDAVRAVFDAKAEAWTEKTRLVEVDGDDAPLDGAIGRLLPPGARLADVGGGNGRLTAKLLGGGARPSTIWLLDLSRAMAEAAARRFQGSVVPVVVAVARAERLPLAPASADAVVLRQLLQHVPDPVAVLTEARRVLRPGGFVAAQVPGRGYLASWLPFAGSHGADPVGRFTAEEMSEAFREAGLDAEVTAHPFAFRFASTRDAVRFLGSIGLLDKLFGYDLPRTHALGGCLDHPLLQGLLGAGGPLTVEGEYLLAVGKEHTR